MKRWIEIKRSGAREQVRRLLEELSDRLEEKLRHFPGETVTLRALFEENGRRTLSRIALTCHVPGHTIAAHEEDRDAGLVIREAFAELERQLEKQKAIARHERLLRRSKQHRPRRRRATTSPGAATLRLSGEHRAA
jgi:ribosome-associated translation inhibitor RaiA